MSCLEASSRDITTAWASVPEGTLTPAGLRSSAMTDEELAEAWESCRLGRAVSHAEHVRISWVLLSRHGTLDGGSRIADGTFRNCVAMDASDRFDSDLTARWTESIASAVESSEAATADKFLKEHPEFLNSRLFGLPAWMQTE